MHDRRGFAGIQANGVHGAIDQIGDAAAGGFASANRTAEQHGFAGDDARHRVAHVDGIGVHHPGHRLFVRADVRGHHVHLRADERDHFLRVTAGETFEFRDGHFPGIAGDAALRAAVGQAGEGAFPTHPHRQRGDFAQGDIGMKTQAALGGTEGQVMLHAVTAENFYDAIVAMDGQGDDHGALRIFEAVAFVLGDLEAVGHRVELLAGHLKSGAVVDCHGADDSAAFRNSE